MNYQDYSFVVEQMSDELAEQLMDLIRIFVASHILTMGGGYRPTTDADYTEAKNAQDA